MYICTDMYVSIVHTYNTDSVEGSHVKGHLYE